VMISRAFIYRIVTSADALTPQLCQRKVTVEAGHLRRLDGRDAVPPPPYKSWLDKSWFDKSWLGGTSLSAWSQ
jgi:hypothetical protein